MDRGRGRGTTDTTATATARGAPLPRVIDMDRINTTFRLPSNTRFHGRHALLKAVVASDQIRNLGLNGLEALRL